MTDNGSSNGTARMALEEGAYRGFDAGMKGMKSTVFEGGHRVPFFFHWPAGGFTAGQDRPQFSAHLDVLPTPRRASAVSSYLMISSLTAHPFSARPQIRRCPRSARSLHHPAPRRPPQRQRAETLFSYPACSKTNGDSSTVKNSTTSQKIPRQNRNIADKHPEIVKRTPRPST